MLGVSSGGPADKEKFVKTNKLNTISLLIDTGDVLRKSWEVPKVRVHQFSLFPAPKLTFSLLYLPPPPPRPCLVCCLAV